MLRLALRNVLRQRARTALTFGAIVLGVASLVLSGGFVRDLLFQLREATIHSQLGHLQVQAVGKHAAGTQRSLDFVIRDTTGPLQAIRAQPGVTAVASRLSFAGLLGNGRGELPIVGEGIEPVPEAQIGSALTLVAGRRLAAQDTDAIEIGEGLAAALRLRVGQRVNLVLSTPEGAMNTLDFRVVGVFRSLSKEYDARAVRIPLASARDLVGVAGVTSIVVLLADTDDTDRVRAALSALLAGGFEVKSWPELADFYTSTEALYRRQFGVLQMIILVMVLLSVANSLNMTLHERTAEFGIIRALGRTARHVFRLAVLEATLLGAAGALAGLAAGALLGSLVSAIGIAMPPPPNSEAGFTAAIRLTAVDLATAFTIGVAATVAAALLPARHLARLPVVDALRRGV